ncbi:MULTISPECIES: pitrilysin family protein [unclassified Mucilaginibacter]|uniref:M16 family metallopeptidase n=1 Tax=unclassified Mucilaginibacter TaxID=2617802 RepID=UPI002AC95E68|nr:MULTISPECIES: pitrilysin family protein [unclassified Mucilaginibacter]MEB0260389.1 pitrilysin family protein [Mucilaginibacter sp. 10I4]MEB0279428.1 pitrilysin family protein [Mucilaginibacter sp. 10B2]MEB0300556.1 pitrilysin family protein [Mucilaginibacter sp. 5C4]WPX21802.1 pitrilysin family protein [Mucilaginibacter sp. 5C4]
MTELDRKTPPQFNGVENITLIRPEATKLANGANIFTFNSGDLDLVRIEWIFHNLRFDPTKPLLNVAVNTMLTEGTIKLTAAQIADKIDFYGAFLQVDFSYDHSQVTLYTLTKHLNSTLPVIKDILTDSIFPQKELETFVRNQQQKLQVSLQKNDFVARRAFNKALYGETIYGLAAQPEDFQSLKREDLLEKYKEMYQPDNCNIIIAGKADPQILEAVTKTFEGAWGEVTVPADTTQPDLNPSAERFIYVEKADAIQSAIRIGTPFVNRTHPDFHALQVLNTVLGGYFGSRLMTNIREDKGYTYGIGSGMSSFKQTGSFFIASEVGADVCKAAVAEIEKEVNLLKTDLIPHEELSLVRNFMLGSLLGSLENVLSHADKFKNLYFAGLDYDYYERYTQTVKNITAEDLKTLANKYFDFEDFYKVIVGKY